MKEGESGFFTSLYPPHPISARNSSSFLCPFIDHTLNLRERQCVIYID